MGTSGAVTRIEDGVVERVVEGLPSIHGGAEIGGPSDVDFVDPEHFYVVVNLAAHAGERDLMVEGVGDVAGWLLRGSIDGTYEPVADIASFEEAQDPDAEFSGGEIFSNPHSVAATVGGAAVVDAGGNSLLQVDEQGAISLLAIFPPMTLGFTMAELSGEASAEAEPGASTTETEASTEDETTITAPVQAVPTSVVVGPDEALYVGQLTGGPYPVGEAAVWRVDGEGNAERYATGFSNIIDLAFGPDGTLYVAELARDSLRTVFEGDVTPVGAVLSVPPGGGEPEVLLSDRRLLALGGITVDDAGDIYVTSGTLTPGGGAVLRIRP
jgi:hypothetical protein